MPRCLPSASPILLLASLAACATATNPSGYRSSSAGTLTVYPVRVDDETARYSRGLATLHRETAVGTVELSLHPVTKKSQVTFDVALFNASSAPVNFGIENISVQIDGVPVAVPSREQLASAEKNKTRSRQIGTALVAGVVAGVASTASNDYTYYRGVRTPRGVYGQAVHVEDDTPGVVGAIASVAAGALVISGMERKLNQTLATINGRVLETTTIDPGNSAGGMIVVPITSPAPHEITVQVRSSGAVYAFAMRLTPSGVNVPPPLPATPRPQDPAALPPEDAPAP